MTILQVAEIDKLFNPEAMINAAIAAKAAELAANQVLYGIGVLIVMVLVIGALMMLVAYKFDELKRNTDGMREELIKTTRNLALIEGNQTGRDEQIKEQKALKTG